MEIVNKGAAAPALTDPNGVLNTLGILQTPYTQTVTAAQDAKFSLDGLNLTRSSNTIGDVIPGATVKLLSGTTATPGVSDINIAQNTDTIVQAVNSLATAYNAIQDFVTTQNAFHAADRYRLPGVAGTSAPLFGDTTLSQIQDQLSSVAHCRFRQHDFGINRRHARPGRQAHRRFQCTDQRPAIRPDQRFQPVQRVRDDRQQHTAICRRQPQNRRHQRRRATL